MKLLRAFSALLFVGECLAFQASTRANWGLSSQTSLTRLNVAAQAKTPGSAKLDTPWEELGFEFRPTNSHVRVTYKDGEWGKPELVQDPFISLHIGATALHYGQACFEGLKAFCHEDGEVYVFRPDENAKRMQRSCFRTMMPELPTESFIEAIQDVVRDNIEYVPPYGSNGSLYIRPLLFGSGPRIGLQPADEYTFLIMVIPVGDYYKGGLSTPVNGLIIPDYDRAAPQGVGAVKVAGNYAADLLPNMLSKKKGYPIGLYLDSKTQSLIEEFSTSNFVGIDNKNKKYVTPKSPSVLPSITNKSLMQIAKDEGFTVEERDIKVEELEDFDEVIAVGTAVVITPVGSITRLSDDGSETVYQFGEEGKLGETTKLLYKKMRDLQNGESDDKYGWNLKISNE
mmetsp:Transcript_45187/g.130483  ORF Transcript_45187/g.130483 Transcript_45187/m.130483 type:complete len:398 (+) Transcript_45187:169-1362(+)